MAAWADFGFFAINLLFTAFNARIAWLNWKRQAGDDFPSISATVAPATADAPLRLDLTITNNSKVVWRAKRAELIHPRKAKVANPALLLTVNEFNEPWHPIVSKLDETTLTRRTSLVVRVEPTGKSYHEQLWLLGPALSGRSATVRLEFVSEDPKPRRYSVQVTRQLPAEASVITA